MRKLVLVPNLRGGCGTSRDKWDKSGTSGTSGTSCKQDNKFITTKQVGNVPRGIMAQLFCIVKLQALAERSLGKDSVSQPLFS